MSWKVGDICRFDVNGTYGISTKITGVAILREPRIFGDLGDHGWYADVIKLDNGCTRSLTSVILDTSEGAIIKPLTKLEKALK